MSFTLRWTPALPAHYVATLADGRQFMVPVDPLQVVDPTLCPAYHGNYRLLPLRPRVIARFYGAEAESEEESDD